MKTHKLLTILGFSTLFLIILLTITACEEFNAPLSDYIGDATRVGMGTRHTFLTDFDLMSDGIVAIPVSETKISVSIHNQQGFSIQAMLEGEGSDKAEVTVSSDNRAAIVTIPAPAHGDEFDLTITFSSTGIPIDPYKLPAMKVLYINANLGSLVITYGENITVNLSPGFSPLRLGYSITMPENVSAFFISATPQDFHNELTITINGETANSGYANVTLTPESPTIIITVKAESGRTRIYTITIRPAVASIGETHYLTLADAIADVEADDVPVTINLLRDIELPESRKSKDDYIIKTGQNIALEGIVSNPHDEPNPEITRKEDNTSTLFHISSDGSLTLESVTLNGNNIDGSDPLVVVEGYFTMNYSESAVNLKNNTASAVRVDAGGVFTMAHGYISDNKAASGGAVFVAAGGKFTMDSGGTISDNIATEDGGGVYVAEGGEFNMNATVSFSATISSNNAKNGGGVYVDGGGIFNMSAYSTNVKAKINENEAANGGGVFVAEDGTFNMSGYGAEINFNTATDGGGVYVAGGTFNMDSQAKIDYNEAANGGGVYVAGGTFNMTNNAEIGSSATGIKNRATVNGGGVYVAGGTFTMDQGNPRILYSEAANGGGVYVNGGEFIFNDGSITNNKAVTEGNDSKGGGVYVAGGKFTFNYGQIALNTAFDGGGVYVAGGNFTMAGGEIGGASISDASTGNTATRNGGGVYVANGGTFTMNDGHIPHNTATDGGGVYLAGGAFIMAGGVIGGDSGLHVSDAHLYGSTVTGNGGGVYVNGGDFLMSGGTIGYNSAAGNGGGIYMNGGDFLMSGGKVLGEGASDGNSASTGKSLFVESGTAVYGGDYTDYGFPPDDRIIESGNFTNATLPPQQ